MMNSRDSAGAWVFIVLLTLVCALIVWGRLAGLPDLGVMLGPDLTVRHVAMERSHAAEGQPFQRGDRLLSIEGMALEDLRDLRPILPTLMEEAASVEEGRMEGVDGLEASPGAEELFVLDYQIWRPIHRFSLALQGENTDPTGLPPGVEPDDRLVEIDGRILPGRVGAEGIRSVIASRPDALLGFERPDAVFGGQMVLDEAPRYPAILLVFLAVIGAIIILWRGHSEALAPAAAYCIALESLCLGFLVLLISDFQWVLADPVLTGAIVIAMIAMRPLAIFAREIGDSTESNGGTIALGIGGLAIVGVLAMLAGELLSSSEQALHVAAIITGLFIVYEVVASGMDRDVSASLAERGGYLPGVILIGLFAALVAAVMEPVAFEEELWRWFAVLLSALVWFGDMLFGLKFGVRSALGEVGDSASRQKLLTVYLQEIALEMPHTDLRIVGVLDGRALAIRRDTLGLQIETVRVALADAVEILLRENTRVPLPEGMDDQKSPMKGIAKTMNISIALPLVPPPGAVKLGGEEMMMALIGMRRASEVEIPGYASTETLDRAQELWTGAVASAAKLELVYGLVASLGPQGPTTASGAAVHQELEEAREAALKCAEEMATLEEEHSACRRNLSIEKRSQDLRRVTHRRSYPAAAEGLDLLEPELEEGLRYLLEGPETILFGGPLGAGKSIAARRAAQLDGRPGEAFLEVDMAADDSSKALDKILGEAGGGLGPGLLEGFDGALLIRSAQHCNDVRLLALCHQVEDKQIRLFLSFDSALAEQRSVLEGRPAPLQELLGHREVIIPSFRRRPSIIRPVLQFWLVEWAYRLGKEVDGFSRTALEVLEAYDYPGEISEAVEIVRLAVLDTDHDVVDRENLPLGVRDFRDF